MGPLEAIVKGGAGLTGEGASAKKPGFFKRLYEGAVALTLVGTAFLGGVGLLYSGKEYFRSHLWRDNDRSGAMASRVAEVYNIPQDRVDDEVSLERADTIADVVGGWYTRFPSEIAEPYAQFIASFDGNPPKKGIFKTPQYRAFLEDPRVRAYLTEPSAIMPDEQFNRENSYPAWVVRHAKTLPLFFDPEVRAELKKDFKMLFEEMF